MYNNYLKELVKVPQAPVVGFDNNHVEPCKSWFYGLCNYDWGDQVAPCVGCVHEHNP